MLAQRKNTAFVLGDMAELGADAEAMHQRIGEKAKDLGIDSMYCLGAYSAKACDSFGDNGKSFVDMDDLLSTLKRDVAQSDESPDKNSDKNKVTTILIKGSRSMKMERAVSALTAVSENDSYRESA